ncbi:MAG: C1 family peptidase [Elusimicrobia bacterium]|nr:C1 family peptidase [Elusimicrobiota bacterium]
MRDAVAAGMPHARALAGEGSASAAYPRAHDDARSVAADAAANLLESGMQVAAEPIDAPADSSGFHAGRSLATMHPLGVSATAGAGATQSRGAGAVAAARDAGAAAQAAATGAAKGPQAAAGRQAGDRRWKRGADVSKAEVRNMVRAHSVSAHAAAPTPEGIKVSQGAGGSAWDGLPVATEKTVTLAQVAAAVKAQGAQWTAGETPISQLPLADLQMRLGGRPATFVSPLLADDAAAPPSLDWREYNGNHVTPVKDQGNCGACWDFAMTAALESYVLTTQGGNAGTLDLSEQAFLSCNSGGYSCKAGGELDPRFLRDYGLPPESYYPYEGFKDSCAKAKAGWQKHAYKIDSWGGVAKNVDSIKAALAHHGPVATGYGIYEDFLYYQSGIYSYTGGRFLGGHAVLIVGYNDDGRYFIVKNSFGSHWGENGYFRIAYSELDSPVMFGTDSIAFVKGAPVLQQAPAR